MMPVHAHLPSKQWHNMAGASSSRLNNYFMLMLPGIFRYFFNYGNDCCPHVGNALASHLSTFTSGKARNCFPYSKLWRKVLPTRDSPSACFYVQPLAVLSRGGISQPSFPTRHHPGLLRLYQPAAPPHLPLSPRQSVPTPFS